jgi:hypothetical protein
VKNREEIELQLVFYSLFFLFDWARSKCPASKFGLYLNFLGYLIKNSSFFVGEKNWKGNEENF